MNSVNEPLTEPTPDASRAPLQVSRRGMLAVGAVGVSATALAACSKAASPSSAPPAAGSSTGSASTGTSSANTPAGPLAKLSDIKVGEAISATGPDGAKIIIARPSQTTVAAFSAICTHQGCTVAPAGKELDCPCHGSVYNATTGEVINGPAPRPLAKVNVSISGDNVVAG
ncbi:MAG: Rieske (2Fe-2S) protein [Jatrophihabitantaceae bacterium]